MNRYVLGLAMAATTSCAALAQTPPPVAAFARLPAVSDAALSPNGQNIAILGGGPVERTITFHVIDQPGVKGTKLGDVETIRLYWAGNDYAIAKIGVYDKVGPRADVRLLRNAVIDREGKFQSFLLQSDQLSSQITNHPILGVIDGSPPKIVVMGLSDAAEASHDMNTRMARKGEGDTRVRAIYAADPITGKGAMTERGDFDTTGWEVDLSGQARVAYKYDGIKKRSSILARPKGAARWKLIQDGDDGRDFLGYSPVEDALYFTKPSDAGLQLYRLLLGTDGVEPIGKPVLAGDLSLIWDDSTNGVAGIRSWGDQVGVEWRDPALASAYGALSRAFKGKTVTLQGWSDDRTRLLASVETADIPATWYLYDRTRKEISPIGEEYPELHDTQFGTTTLFRYKARDGLEVPAYLTIPAALAAGARAPLVVMPHGGPNSRDIDAFDYLAQFLVSRGYAVLRPQFRGSTGFGQAFEDAGKGEWGGKMQTDVADAVAAVAPNAAVDTRRACIVGASFGGYSALWAAVFGPQPYRCAASINGVSDLGTMITEWGTDFGRDTPSFVRFRDAVRATSPEGLSKVSPLKNAGGAALPVLLIHAAQDTTVGPTHSRQMNEALKRGGKAVEYVEIAGENHYLRKASSRQVVLETLEAFLAKNLGSSATPADR